MHAPATPAEGVCAQETEITAVINVMTRIGDSQPVAPLPKCASADKTGASCAEFVACYGLVDRMHERRLRKCRRTYTELPAARWMQIASPLVATVRSIVGTVQEWVSNVTSLLRSLMKPRLTFSALRGEQSSHSFSLLRITQRQTCDHQHGRGEIGFRLLFFERFNTGFLPSGTNVSRRRRNSRQYLSWNYGLVRSQCRGCRFKSSRDSLSAATVWQQIQRLFRQKQGNLRRGGEGGDTLSTDGLHRRNCIGCTPRARTAFGRLPEVESAECCSSLLDQYCCYLNSETPGRRDPAPDVNFHPATTMTLCGTVDAVSPNTASVRLIRKCSCNHFSQSRACVRLHPNGSAPF